ncbi:MAG: histidinol dehydrogenase [Desulfovibrio sp.]|nr:histidinol dehydrogenase [Desulfovibrio sp.]
MIGRFLKIKDDDYKQSFAWLKSRSVPDAETERQVADIINAVNIRGADALLEYTRKFDCPDFRPPFRVSPEAINDALAKIPSADREILRRAADNILAFHREQREKSWFVTRDDGSILGQRVAPVAAAGLYAPGGKNGDTPLVSSLLMNASPAIVAGCPRIVVITPPRRDGNVNDYILAAAAILNIEEIYALGGPWGIAALALGVVGVMEPVDVIAGPGNIYVTTAKRLLHGRVGIDMIAGPSEVLILADDSANPDWIAADMLSQAEHDPLASAICVTDSEKIANETLERVEIRARQLPRKEIALRSLRDWGCVALTRSMDTAINIANYLAPEHLEVCCQSPWDYLPRIKNAGAIFLGHYCPEPVGDYFAGPNHVLPTMGSARFASSLSVQNFCKKTNIIYTPASYLTAHSTDIARLAEIESLRAHALSVRSRSGGD